MDKIKLEKLETVKGLLEEMGVSIPKIEELIEEEYLKGYVIMSNLPGDSTSAVFVGQHMVKHLFDRCLLWDRHSCEIVVNGTFSDTHGMVCFKLTK